MLTIATQVTTVIALIAFVSALFVFAYRSRLKNDLEIVKSADTPDKIRAIRSLKGAVFDIDSGKLTGSQTLSLAKAQLAASSSKATKLALALVVLALILAATSFALNLQSKPDEKPTSASLLEFLKTADSESNIDRLLSTWGPAFAILASRDVYDETLLDEAVTDSSDLNVEPRVPLLLDQDYTIEVYNVENKVDLYIVRVRNEVSAIGVGSIASANFKLPMLDVLTSSGEDGETKSISSFHDATLKNFGGDSCGWPQEMDGLHTARGYFGPVECVYGRCCGGFGAEHHFYFSLDRTCNGAGGGVTSAENPDQYPLGSSCDPTGEKLLNARPYLALAYVGNLSPDIPGDYRVLRAISDVVGDYAFYRQVRS